MRFLQGLFLAAMIQAMPALAATKIMALGDSITGSPGCWRALLWQKLQAAGITDTDFVGTLSGQGCGFAYDGENEGHGGYLATNIASQNMLVGWLAQTNPNIVMMHLGTNDVWSNKSPAELLGSFDILVDQMRANNPAMKILVAQIIPMGPSPCAECGPRVVAFNAAIPAWAAQRSTGVSPITVVDVWTGFNTATDTGDGVHPNENGNVKIAASWFAPLAAAITGGAPVPSTSTTTSTSTKPTSTTSVKVTSTTTSSSVVVTTTGVPSTGGGGPWAQCGGQDFSGPTYCVSGYVCKFSNQWYSQCLPA